MKYVVKTRYEDFDFNDGDEALSFAELAVEHSMESASVMIEVTDDKAEYHLKEADQ